MNTVTVVIGSGASRRVFRFPEGSWAYRSLMLVIEQINPFWPAYLAKQSYDVHILSTESASGNVVEGIRISKLVDEGQVNVRLLDREGQSVEPDQELLDRVVIVPAHDRPADRGDQLARSDQNDQIVVHAAEAVSPPPVEESPAGPSPEAPTPLPKKVAEAWPGPEQPRRTVRIRVWEEALGKARAHAARHLTHEVGGICVGFVRRDGPVGRLAVEVTDTFVAEHTLHRGAAVTFTPDTWSAATRTVERDYAGSGEYMVGWYHTHPGFGVFLSSWDLFFQEHFFDQPWHIALVIDPCQGGEGFFAWTDDGGARAVAPCREVELLAGSHRNRRPAPAPATPPPEPGPAQAEANVPAAAMPPAAASPDETLAPTGPPTGLGVAAEGSHEEDDGASGGPAETGGADTVDEPRPADDRSAS